MDLSAGPFVGRDAVAAGLVTRRQLDGPSWRRLLPDVYAPAGLDLDHRDLCFAAGLFLGGRGAVSGLSAAALWGAPDPAGPVEVTVPDRLRLRAAALTVVRSGLPPSDVASCGGLRITTPVRTAFDLARRLPLVDGVCAVDAMLNRRLVSAAAVHALAGGRRRWPGLQQLRVVLDLVDAGAESPMESRVRLLLVQGGLPRPVTQFVVGGYRLDLAYPDCQVGIEYEGAHHREATRFQRDLRRIETLRARGWTVLRFGPTDVYRDPDRTLALVRRALVTSGRVSTSGGRPEVDTRPGVPFDRHRRRVVGRP